MKYSIKQLLREPVKLLLFILILSVSTFFLILQTILYHKSVTELTAIYRSYDVVGTLSVQSDHYHLHHETPMSDRPDSTLFYQDDVMPIFESDYIAAADARRVLCGTIPMIKKMPDSWALRGYPDFLGIGKIVEKNEEKNEKLFQVTDTWFSYSVKNGDILPLREVAYDDPIHPELFPLDESFPLMEEGESYLMVLRFYGDRYVRNNDIPMIGINDISQEGTEKVEIESYKNSSTELRQRALTYNTAGYSFPLQYTKDLLHIPDFYTGKVDIMSGRAFTQEDYKNGNKVCIISKEVALENNIEIGAYLPITVSDMLNMDGGNHKTLQYLPDQFPVSVHVETGRLSLDYNFMLPEEDYKVVGIYERLVANIYDPYYFDNNTIFVPDSTWDLSSLDSYSEDMEYRYKRHSYRRNTFSFLLKSPEYKDAFLMEIQENGFPIKDLEIHFLDGRLYQIADTLSTMKSSALLLLVLACILLVFIFLLLAFFYISRKKKEYICMCLLGQEIRKCKATLLVNLMLVGTIGILAGCIFTAAISEKYFSKVYNTMTAGFESEEDRLREEQKQELEGLTDIEKIILEHERTKHGPVDIAPSQNWVEKGLDMNTFSGYQIIIVGLTELLLLFGIAKVTIHYKFKGALLLLANVEGE